MYVCARPVASVRRPMAARTTFAQSRPSSSPTARTSVPASSHVLSDLLRERAAIEPIRVAVPHLWSLLDAEIARVGAAAADANAAASISSLAAGLSRSHPAYVKRSPDPAVAPAAVRKRVKLPVPADKYPEYNFVGRLLGPRGTTLKTLERDTACKIMIRGKGSIRKDKEPDVRGKPGWEHVFNEALHVVIEVGDALDDASAAIALQRAKEAVEVLLVPVPEERDSLKRQQLRALAIMNGTYRGGNPARSLDSGLAGLAAFSASPPGPQSLHSAYPGLDPTATPMYLGDSVAAAMSPSVFPGFEQAQHEEHGLFRPVQYARYENSYDRKPTSAKPSGRRTPSSGATSPKPGMYDNNGAGSDMGGLTAKMQHCAVDEFASSSVGDDSPESSHSSDDGEPSTHIMGNGYSGAAKVKVSAMSPGSRAETAVGVGGFLGQEFYNGAFSNGPSPNPSWDQAGPSPGQFSSGLYGFSPIPSPQVLTASTSTVTPIERHDGY